MVSKFANITYQPGLDLQVEIGKMRDKFGEKFPWHKACPSCKEDIGKRSYCKNQRCEFSNELPKAEDTSRKIDKVIDGKTKTLCYPKEMIAACKSTDNRIRIVGKEKKDIDKTRILDCHYVFPGTRGNESKKEFYLLYSGLKNSGYALSVITARTGIENHGVLTVEGSHMVLFTMASVDQIRPATEFFISDEKIQVDRDLGVRFIENLETFDSTKFQSQTIKNYEVLLNRDL